MFSFLSVFLFSSFFRHLDVSFFFFWCTCQHFNRHIQRPLSDNLLRSPLVQLGTRKGPHDTQFSQQALPLTSQTHFIFAATSITGDTNTSTCAHTHTIFRSHTFSCRCTCLSCLSSVSLHKPPVYKAVSQHLLCSRLPEGLASAGPIITALYLSGSFWAE